MTHLRRGFRSRAPAPSDSYRRMFATLAAPTRAIPSRDTPASAPRVLPETSQLISQPSSAINARGETFSYNGLINLTRVVIKWQCYRSIVTTSRTTRALTTCGGSQGSGTNPRDLSGMPSVRSILPSMYLHAPAKKPTVPNHYYLSSSIIDRYYPI